MVDCMKKYLSKKVILAIVFAVFGAAAFVCGDSASAKTLDISRTKYGYGEYTLTARATDANGVSAERSVTYYYLPVVGELVEGGEDGEYVIDLDYDDDDGSETGLDDVELIEIIITDSEGNPIESIPPIYVEPPQVEVVLDFNEYGLDDGEYMILINAYGDDTTKPLYEPYIIKVKYDGSEVIVVPNTGNVTQTLNIMKNDYLVTGLIIFGIIALSGIMIVSKKNR